MVAVFGFLCVYHSSIFNILINKRDGNRDRAVLMPDIIVAISRVPAFSSRLRSAWAASCHFWEEPGPGECREGREWGERENREGVEGSGVRRVLFSFLYGTCEVPEVTAAQSPHWRWGVAGSFEA